MADGSPGTHGVASPWGVVVGAPSPMMRGSRSPQWIRPPRSPCTEPGRRSFGRALEITLRHPASRPRSPFSHPKLRYVFLVPTTRVKCTLSSRSQSLILSFQCPHPGLDLIQWTGIRSCSVRHRIRDLSCCRRGEVGTLSGLLCAERGAPADDDDALLPPHREGLAATPRSWGWPASSAHARWPRRCRELGCIPDDGDPSLRLLRQCATCRWAPPRILTLPVSPTERHG